MHVAVHDTGASSPACARAFHYLRLEWNCNAIRQHACRSKARDLLLSICLGHKRMLWEPKRACDVAIIMHLAVAPGRDRGDDRHRPEVILRILHRHTATLSDPGGQESTHRVPTTHSAATR